MTEKGNLKLTKKQLGELSCLAKRVAGLRQTQIDIAEKIGELNQDLWKRFHEIFPEVEDGRFRVDWDTGDVTEAKDC